MQKLTRALCLIALIGAYILTANNAIREYEKLDHIQKKTINHQVNAIKLGDEIISMKEETANILHEQIVFLEKKIEELIQEKKRDHQREIRENKSPRGTD